MMLFSLGAIITGSLKTGIKLVIKICRNIWTGVGNRSVWRRMLFQRWRRSLDNVWRVWVIGLMGRETIVLR